MIIHYYFVSNIVTMQILYIFTLRHRINILATPNSTNIWLRRNLSTYVLSRVSFNTYIIIISSLRIPAIFHKHVVGYSKFVQQAHSHSTSTQIKVVNPFALRSDTDSV